MMWASVQRSEAGKNSSAEFNPPFHPLDWEIPASLVFRKR